MENTGWTLSPLYDVNPDIYGEYLSLNVDNEESDLDFELAVKAAKYYGIDEKQAREIINMISTTVRDNWQLQAKKFGISRAEMERMKPAFMICG